LVKMGSLSSAPPRDSGQSEG